MNSRPLPDDSELLAKQLAMTKQTWRRLHSHGVNANTEIHLDFFYNAPTRAAALELQQLLQRETDYDVRVVSNREIWGIRGSTQATKVDEQILLEWVDWMVTAGLQHQVVFDGWGAKVPR